MFFCFCPGPEISSSACGPEWAETPLNHCFRPVGIRPKETLFPRQLRKTIPDSVVTFFFDFGTPVALGPVKGLEGLACLLAAAYLLDVQAPPQWSNNLINRLKYYVLQLGDPNRNQDWVLGPSCANPFSTLSPNGTDRGRHLWDQDTGGRSEGGLFLSFRSECGCLRFSVFRPEFL